MIKKFQNLLQKFPLLSFLGNKYYLTLIGFIIWMLFFDNYSYFEHRFLNDQIDELNDNKKYYKSEIAKDSIKIKNLKNDNMTEKYAREKYFMKKDSEDIYIIEFEEDKIKDSLLEAKK
ncbi:septum formation initiator family protein [Flavobacterium sp.]|jgi:cell division protein FtsB|uniref:FtsB family cell division protein n=1 Tax=Flavobacterium sp. TaxID=239 RepID=UPI0033406D41